MIDHRIPHRRALELLCGVTAVAALAGAAQLLTGSLTPPVEDLEPLGLESWVVPGLWLLATVAVPCGVATVLCAREDRHALTVALVAAGLLAVELVVQVPFVGTDPLQAVMGTVAALVAALAGDGVRRLRAADPTRPA